MARLRKMKEACARSSAQAGARLDGRIEVDVIPETVQAVGAGINEVAKGLDATGHHDAVKVAEPPSKFNPSGIVRLAGELRDTEWKLVQRSGRTPNEIVIANHRGLDKDPSLTPEGRDMQILDPKKSEDRSTLKLYDERKKRTEDNKQGYTLDPDRPQVIEGARPFGDFPDTRVDFKDPALAPGLEKAERVRISNKTPEEKIHDITKIVGGDDGEAGMLLSYVLGRE